MFRIHFWLHLFLGGLLILFSCALPAQEYTVINLTLGGPSSYAADINEAGQVIGYSSTTDDSATHAFLYDGTKMVDLGTLGGPNSYARYLNETGQVIVQVRFNTPIEQRAFLYDGTTMVDLGTLGGSFSYAADINEAGQVIGRSYTADDSVIHAFLYDDTTMVDLGTLGGSFSVAIDINDAGQVVGYSQITDSATHAFLYDGTKMVDLGTLGGTNSYAHVINEAGQVIGSYITDSTTHAFLYDGTKMVDLNTLGGTNSYAYAVNEAGQVAGGFSTTDGATYAFLYDGTKMVDLGTLGGLHANAIDINDAGQVVGYSQITDSATHAFLYDGTKMVDLGTLGGTNSYAHAINEAGQVIGYSSTINDSGIHAFLYDGTKMVDLNNHIPSVPNIELHDAYLLSDSGFIVASSDAGTVLLSPVSSAAPTVGPISLSIDPVPVATSVEANADFSDNDASDTHTAVWHWGDGSDSTVGVVTEDGQMGNVVGTHTFSAAGIYSLSLTVTDSTSLEAQVARDVIVYDPSAGFVTGGGWIMSEPGAYKEDANLSGRATFGFVSKYKKGANVPTGNTEFQFHAANLNFHSDSYEWLVVTGSNYARYKGEGTINGLDKHKFMLWAGDGTSSDGEDTFRIKIWDEDNEGNETVIYDNGMDQAIGGGNIVVHAK